MTGRRDLTARLVKRLVDTPAVSAVSSQAAPTGARST
jgi:hypothetical protein